MALDFPPSPALNYIYTYGGRSWQWNGTAWDVYSTTNVVNYLNGLTGTVGLSGGTSISVTPSGNTLVIAYTGAGGGSVSSVSGSGNGISVSPTTGAVIVQNTGVHSLNGFTGTVNVRAGQGITLLSGSNGITLGLNYWFGGQTFAVTSGSGIKSYDYVLLGQSGGAGPMSLSPIRDILAYWVPVYQTASGYVTSVNGLQGAVSAVSSMRFQNDPSGATGDITFTQYVSSFNGKTGAVQGVSSASAGTGIALSGSTGAITITNAGVQSFNGLTGAVTGVTTGTANTFGPLQSFTNGISATGATFYGTINTSANISGTANSIQINSSTVPAGSVLEAFFETVALGDSIGDLQNVFITLDNTGNNISYNSATHTFSGTDPALVVSDSTTTNNFAIGPGSSIISFSAPDGGVGTNTTFLNFPSAVAINNVTLPSTSTTLAGLAINQTFTGNNTFSSLARFSAGISASGATLSSNTNIPAGSTLTVNGNFVANGNVNLGDAITDAITVTGLLVANGGLSASGGTFASNVSFNSTTSHTGLASFTSGISAAGGTFSALTRFTAGISASGATFTGPVNLTNTLLLNGTQGSNNQVLTSTGSGITWATPAGSVTSVEGLTGDVLLPAVDLYFFSIGII